MAVVSGCQGVFHSDTHSDVQKGNGLKSKQRRGVWVQVQTWEGGQRRASRERAPFPSPDKQWQGAGPKDESWWEMDVSAALGLGTCPRHSLSATVEQTKPEVLRQTLHTAGKQGPSVPFNALISLILYLCSPSEERTHSGSFIMALITAAGIKAPGGWGAGLCSCRKPIPF